MINPFATAQGTIYVPLVTGNTDMTYTLPKIPAGSVICVIKTDTGTGNVTIAAPSGTSLAIDGSVVLGSQNGSATFCYDGYGNWAVINTYNFGFTSTTFTANGGGLSSSAVSIGVSKMGNVVTIFIPPFGGTSGTGTTIYSSNTALPTWARPLTTSTTLSGGLTKNNGASANAIARWTLGTTGLMDMYRDASQTAFTNSVACGLQAPATLVYSVCSGS